MSNQHAQSAPVTPAPVDPAMLRRVRRFRVTRDLVVVALGVFVFIVGLVAGGSSTTWGLAIAMIVIFAIAAYAHSHMRSYRQAFTRRGRLILSLIGLVLGLYLGAAGIAGFGGFGQQGTGIARNCVFVPATHQSTSHGVGSSRPAHNVCDATVTWPDGTSSQLAVDLPTNLNNGTRVLLHRPAAAFDWLAGPGVQTPWADALALVLTCLLLVGQAVASMIVLATGAHGDRPGPPVRR